MKIKSFVLGLTFLGLSAAAFAQKAELTAAKDSYEKYAVLKGNKLGQSNITTAQASIDKASTNDKTKDLAETWAYRAMIYADLVAIEKDETKAAALLNEASAAIKKAGELDAKGEQKANIDRAQKTLYNYALNKGVAEYKAQKYTEAYDLFNKSSEYIPGDTTATYFAGVSAMYAKDYPKAIEKYSKLLTTNYSALEDIYTNLSVVYAAQKDTANAIRIAGEGAKRFPKNSTLATREIEFSLMSGKQKEVIDKISAQAQKEPGNKLYPYYLGIAYSSLKDNAKAEEAYKKALEIDPNYADAAINLSGLIMNNGIDIYNKANKLPTSKQKEYADEMKKANAEFDRSLPYLQKAVEASPKSELALRNLKTYYSVKNNKAKADEIQKRIDAL